MREPDFSLDDYAEFGKVRAWSTTRATLPIAIGLVGLSIGDAKQVIADLAAAIEWHERRKDAAEESK